MIDNTPKDHEEYLTNHRLPKWDANCKTDKERVALILEERNRQRIVPPTDRLVTTFVCNIHP